MPNILLLDYDGTLTPLVQRPEEALLSQERRQLLKKLAAQKNIKLAIVTGRGLRDIKKLLRLPELIYIGNHGFEIEFRKKVIVPAAARRSRPLFQKLVRELRKALKPYTGCQIEDKKWTVSVHYRRVTAAQQNKVRHIVRHLITPLAKDKKLLMTTGKKVIGFRPPVPWDKGQAVLWLLKKYPSYSPVYIGDDITDEDAFRVLRKKGQTYYVGSKKKTLAKKRLKDVRAVYALLRTMLQ